MAKLKDSKIEKGQLVRNVKASLGVWVFNRWYGNILLVITVFIIASVFFSALPYNFHPFLTVFLLAVLFVVCRLLSKKFPNVGKARWITICFLFTIILLIMQCSSSLQASLQADRLMSEYIATKTGQELETNLSLAGYSPCDFLPDPEVIPSRYDTFEPETTSLSCRQKYVESGRNFSSVVSVEVRLFENREEARGFHSDTTEVKKLRFREFKAPPGCLSFARENSRYSLLTTTHCQLYNVVVTESLDINTTSISFLLLSDHLVFSKVHNNVFGKILRAGERKKQDVEVQKKP